MLHNTGNDWSKQQIAGIVRTLGRYSTAVIEVVDCEFSYGAQNAALERLSRDPPSVVISIPIGNTPVAASHRSVARAGACLILLDNAPTGLLPGTDYASAVLADNFGLGQIAAETLSPYLPADSSAGILSYGVDFFVTHQREIAFRKWMLPHNCNALRESSGGVIVRSVFSGPKAARTGCREFLVLRVATPM